MASFIEFLQGNPLYIVGLFFLIIFFIVSLLKKAIKLLVIALILFIGYSYYLNDIFDEYQSSNEGFGLFLIVKESDKYGFSFINFDNVSIMCCLCLLYGKYILN